MFFFLRTEQVLIRSCFVLHSRGGHGEEEDEHLSTGDPLSTSEQGGTFLVYFSRFEELIAKVVHTHQQRHQFFYTVVSF